MAGITVNDLIDRGPQAVREFLSQKHTRDEFDPTFSWLLFAERIGLEIAEADDRGGDPIRAAHWAGIAADIYEQMLPGVKPEYESTRRIWTRCIVRYRARAAGVVIPSAPPLPGQTASAEKPIPSI